MKFDTDKPDYMVQWHRIAYAAGEAISSRQSITPGLLGFEIVVKDDSPVPKRMELAQDAMWMGLDLLCNGKVFEHPDGKRYVVYAQKFLPQVFRPDGVIMTNPDYGKRKAGRPKKQQEAA